MKVWLWLVPSLLTAQITQYPSAAILPFPGVPSGSCAYNQLGINRATGDLYSCPSGSWVKIGGGGGALPTGAVVAITTGTCPSGTTEAADLEGMMLYGTVAANMDVGTTGGSDSITPAGTVSQPTFTGNAVSTNLVSAGTPAGTNSAPALTMDSYTPAGSVAAPIFSGSAGTVPAETFTGSSATTSSNSAGTPAGTNSGGSFTDGAISWPASVPTFTGAAMATHQHELPFQDPTSSGTTNFRGISASTFGTGTSRAGVWGITTSSSTTSAAVALSQAVSAGTPSGTVAWPASVPTIAAGTFTQPTFAGSALAGHTHTVTATGTNGTVSFTPAGTNSAPAFTGTPATLTGSVAAPTFSGSALGTHSHTVTATGSVSQPTFAGSAFDNRSAFTKAIFCRAN